MPLCHLQFMSLSFQQTAKIYEFFRWELFLLSASSLSSHLISLMCFIMYQLVVYCFALSIISVMEDCYKNNLMPLQNTLAHSSISIIIGIVWWTAKNRWLAYSRLVYLDDYKWMLSSMMLPQLWNAPWGVTESLLMAWSDLVWFANGWKWDYCLQANK